MTNAIRCHDGVVVSCAMTDAVRCHDGVVVSCAMTDAVRCHDGVVVSCAMTDAVRCQQEFLMTEIESQVDEMLFKMNALAGTSNLPEKPPAYYTDSDCSYAIDSLSNTGSEVSISWAFIYFIFFYFLFFIFFFFLLNNFISDMVMSM